MPNLTERVERPELMDTVTFEEPVVRRTLSFLGMTARRFGGARVIEKRLDEWSPRWPRDAEISILDVGTGGGEIPVALARWARTTGRKLRIVALDLMPEIAAIAESNTADWPEIDVRCADVFDLAKRGERFDYVTASLFLHHVPTPRIPEILKLFDAIAARGVIISDLERSTPSLLSVSALAYLTGNHVVRHDAPLSVRRAFTQVELDGFAREAGLNYLRARREAWFRISLSGERA